MQKNQTTATLRKRKIFAQPSTLTTISRRKFSLSNKFGSFNGANFSNGMTQEEAPDPLDMQERNSGPSIARQTEEYCSKMAEMVTKHIESSIELQFQRFDESQRNYLEQLGTFMQSYIDERFTNLEKIIEDRIESLEKEEKNQYKVHSHPGDLPYHKPKGFPLKSEEDFTVFENSKELQDSLKEYLVFLGGVSTKDALKQFLKEAMSDDLVKEFTWSGRTVQNEETPALYNTHLGQVFFEAVAECKTLKTPSLTEFSDYMIKAVRTAKQRYRDRARPNRLQKPVGGRQRYINNMKGLYRSDAGGNETTTPQQPPLEIVKVEQMQECIGEIVGNSCSPDI